MSTKRKKNTRQKLKVDVRALPQIQPDAAGIDVGASEMWVSVPVDRDEHSVQSFGTFTQDLHDLADWLIQCRVKSVAMESTGVFWIPLHDLLKSRGFEVFLVNAKHVKNVPGRKSDVLDCQWLQTLHSRGLLRGSFRPEADFVALRTYARQRESLVEDRSMQCMHMQKALSLMNVQIHHAISDITGTTGLKILRSIVAGERDPHTLAKHRDHRCKSSEEEIARALQGEYRDEHVFCLRQSLELYDIHDQKIQECDQQIAGLLEKIAKATPKPRVPEQANDATPKPAKRRKKSKVNKQFNLDIEDRLVDVTLGVKLTSIPGLAELSVVSLLGEIGTDMSAWPTAKHFASWATVSPNRRISGGKDLPRRHKTTPHRVAVLFRQAAVSVGKTDTALGGFYRRIGKQKGNSYAVVATAHKLAVLVYTMLKNGTTYADTGADTYEKAYRARMVKNLKRNAERYGFDLTPKETEPVPARETCK